MAARLGEVLGSGRVTQKGALGGGKITHLLFLERGVWLGRRESATIKGAHHKRDVRV
jgi:hypothetical protein